MFSGNSESEPPSVEMRMSSAQAQGKRVPMAKAGHQGHQVYAPSVKTHNLSSPPRGCRMGFLCPKRKSHVRARGWR